MIEFQRNIEGKYIKKCNELLGAISKHFTIDEWLVQILAKFRDGQNAYFMAMLFGKIILFVYHIQGEIK